MGPAPSGTSSWSTCVRFPTWGHQHSPAKPMATRGKLEDRLKDKAKAGSEIVFTTCGQQALGMDSPG